jgi:hypothetical protein
MPSVELQPTISAGELPQNYTLDSWATGMLLTTPTICVNSPSTKGTETHRTLEAEKHTGNLR